MNVSRGHFLLTCGYLFVLAPFFFFKTSFLHWITCAHLPTVLNFTSSRAHGANSGAVKPSALWSQTFRPARSHAGPRQLFLIHARWASCVMERTQHEEQTALPAEWIQGMHWLAKQMERNRELQLGDLRTCSYRDTLGEVRVSSEASHGPGGNAWWVLNSASTSRGQGLCVQLKPSDASPSTMLMQLVLKRQNCGLRCLLP